MQKKLGWFGINRGISFLGVRELSLNRSGGINPFEIEVQNIKRGFVPYNSRLEGSWEGYEGLLIYNQLTFVTNIC